MKRLSVPLCVAVTLLAGGTTMAQVGPRVAVSGSIGVGTDNQESDVAAGGAVLADLTERFAIEGLGKYLRHGEGANAVTASGSLMVNLLPTRDALVPYGAVGVGFYRVSFDLDRPRFLGPTGTQFAAGTSVCPAPGTGFGPGPGPGFGSGTATCAGGAGYWGVGALPAFYARRLGSLPFPRGTTWGTREFTDPVVNLGGGVRFHVTERLMVRPDARTLFVFTGDEVESVGVFVVHVAYRF
jgi:hypothetical protein